MAGILDFLTGNDQAASPWGALYQQPQPQAFDSEGRPINVTQLPGGPTFTPDNPFGDPSKMSAVPAPPMPSPSVFAGGAAPFSFGGPGPGAAPFGAGAQPVPYQTAGGLPQPAGPTGAPSNPPKPAAPIVAQTDQADPIKVGNYSMPRIGPADAFDPEEVLPAKAQPAAGQAPLSMAGPAQPQSPGFGDRLAMGAKGFLGNMQLGPIGALLGGAGALISGKPTDPTTIANQKSAAALTPTAQAILNKGGDPIAVQAAMAQAAGGNTTPLNDMFKQYYGADKFQHVTVKNPDGSESPQAFDPTTGKYSGAAAPPPGKFSVDPNLTGKDRLDALKAVDPLYARKIEAMVAGDIPMPTGVAALRPDAKRMIEDALAVDGSTSASDFQTRAATRKDYASGIASRVTKSINTTIGHFATLDQAINGLGNYSYFPKVSNAVHDLYSSNLDPNYQKAKATFETNKEAAIKELDFALSGGHSSVSGSAELRDKFNRADSPEALHAAVTEAMSLLQKRLESHTKAFTEGTKSQRDPQDFIYPENRQSFSKMLGQPDAAGNAAPAQQGAPAPGAYVWTPQGGLVGGK